MFRTVEENINTIIKSGVCPSVIPQASKRFLLRQQLFEYVLCASTSRSHEKMTSSFYPVLPLFRYLVWSVKHIWKHWITQNFHLIHYHFSSIHCSNTHRMHSIEWPMNFLQHFLVQLFFFTPNCFRSARLQGKSEVDECNWKLLSSLPLQINDFRVVFTMFNFSFH